MVRSTDTDQFNDLMSVAKAIVSNEKSFQGDELLEWHIKWALDLRQAVAGEQGP